MRRPFSQVLKENKLDIKKEYSRLFQLFYETDLGNGYTPCYASTIIENNFIRSKYRGTCLSFDDFNQTCGFNFEKYPHNFDIDYLVNFCEYVIHFVIEFAPYLKNDFVQTFLIQVDTIIDKIGYMRINDEGKYIRIIEKNQAAISVSEILPAPTSYKVIFYNHHSLKGNLIEKKSILNQLYLLLEPRRKELHGINPKLEDMIFYCFNNLNMRHRNTAVGDKQYKEYVAKMSNNELENWYDETYQMCLLAFLELDNSNRYINFEQLKKKIEAKS